MAETLNRKIRSTQIKRWNQVFFILIVGRNAFLYEDNALDVTGAGE
jgi:hypothetical protein